MKQFNAFASTFHIKALVCCSAAVLLSACGGGNIDTGSQPLAATAASVATDAGAAPAASTAVPAATVETIAEAAPAAINEAAAPASNEAVPTAGTPGATAQAADVATQAFDMKGYDSASLQTQTEQQDASAVALASTRQ